MNKIAINMDDDYYKYAMYKIFNAYDVRISFSDKSNDYWASNFCERTKKFNDLIDNNLLYSVYRNCVSYLITNDEKLKKKSKKIGIDDRVLKIEEAINNTRIPNPGLLAAIASGPEGDSRREKFKKAIGIIRGAVVIFFWCE